MRILVVGGFGYLGGRIALNLIEQGHQVILGTRRERKAPEWLPQAEVSHMVWSDEDILQGICENVDVVIHSAGMNSKDCASDAVAALEFNGVATTRLARASKKAGVKLFIYISTIHVYQYPFTGEITEDSCPKNRHPYATTHLAGENAVLCHNDREDNFKGVILRLSNAVGAPTQKNVNCWMLVVNDICRQVVTKRKIEMLSHPLVVRDFISIKSICNSISSLIIKRGSIDEDILHVVSSKTITLLELTNIVADRSKVVLGYKPSVIFKDSVPISKSNFKISNLKLSQFIDVSKMGLVDEIDDLLLKTASWFN